MRKEAIPGKFYNEIRSIIEQARQRANRAINFAMVEAYWMIGKRIVEEEQKGKNRAEYGEYIIKTLSQKLAGEFGTGFSVANLKNFRQFYRTFPGFEKSYALSSELSWTHYRISWSSSGSPKNPGVKNRT